LTHFNGPQSTPPVFFSQSLWPRQIIPTTLLPLQTFVPGTVEQSVVEFQNSHAPTPSH
jgi:hypothetical protein